MKKMRKIWLLLCLLAALLPCTLRKVSAYTSLYPDTTTRLTEVTAKNINKEESDLLYTTLHCGDTASYDSVEILPVTVGQSGVLVIDAMGMATDHGITMNLYSKPDASADSQVGYSLYFYSSTEETSKNYTVSKGTYYLKIETSHSSGNAGAAQSVLFQLKLYPRMTTLSSGKAYALGASDGSKYNLQKIKVTKSGYLKVEMETLDTASGSSFTAALYSSSKKALYKSTVYSQDGYAYFAVKKGTYYIGVKTYNSLYAMRATFHTWTDKTGSSRGKAVTLKKGKTTKGLILSTDSTSKGHYIKFSLSKDAEVHFTITTRSSAGTMKVELLNANGRSNASKLIYNGSYSSYKTDIQPYTVGNGNKLKKGTYYLKISSYKKGSNFTYSVKYNK